MTHRPMSCSYTYYRPRLPLVSTSFTVGNLEKLTFVAKHQRHGEQSILTTRSAPYCGVQPLEAVNKKKSEQDDVSRHLGRVEYVVHPFAKRGLRSRLHAQPMKARRLPIRSECLRRPENLGGLEPEEASHLQIIIDTG